MASGLPSVIPGDGGDALNPPVTGLLAAGYPRGLSLLAGLIMAALGVLLAGCQTPRLRPGADPGFDAVEASLQDGDVAVMLSAAPDAALLGVFSNGAAPGPVYSHAELLLRSARGEWLLAGVSSGKVQQRPLRRAVGGLLRLAVYRARLPQEQRDEIPRQMRLWLEDPVLSRASFDYTMQDVPGRSSSLYCVGFANEIYRRAALPEPFPRTARALTRIGDHLQQLAGVRPEQVVNANAVKQNSCFLLAGTWRNPAFSDDDVLVREETARGLLRDYEADWRLTPARGVNVSLLVGEWFYGFPRSAEAVARYGGAYLDYAHSIQRTWDRAQRRGRLQGLTVSEKSALLESIREAYRPAFGVSVQPDPGMPVSPAVGF